MAIIRRYIEAGKPVVGIRTACHAFDTRGHAPAGHAEWKTFDPDVLGGHYTGHHGNDAQAGHRSGRERQAACRSSTESRRRSPARARSTRSSPLASSARPAPVGNDPGHPPEPVAWINAKGTARIFYTSLGHPGDFATPAFRRLLLNAVLWALDRPPSQAARPANQPGAATIAGRPASLLNEARARSRPARPWPLSRSPTTSSSTWSWPSRSSGSRSRSASTSAGGSGSCSTCNIPIPRACGWSATTASGGPSTTRSRLPRPIISAARTRSRSTRTPTATASTTGTRRSWTA